MLKKLLRKILCFIGYHSFEWSLRELGLPKDGSMPKGAKCKLCGFVN